MTNNEIDLRIAEVLRTITQHQAGYATGEQYTELIDLNSKLDKPDSRLTSKENIEEMLRSHGAYRNKIVCDERDARNILITLISGLRGDEMFMLARSLLSHWSSLSLLTGNNLTHKLYLLVSKQSVGVELPVAAELSRDSTYDYYPWIDLVKNKHLKTLEGSGSLIEGGY